MSPRTAREPKVVADIPERELLNRRLLGLAEEGRPVSCAGSPLLTSEDQEDRALLGRVWCPCCPARQECAAAGEHETWGVWDGTDRCSLTPQPEPGSPKGDQ